MSRIRLAAFVSALLVVGLLAGLAVQTVRLRDAQDRVDGLEVELAALEAEVSELQAEVAAAEDGAGDGSGDASGDGSGDGDGAGDLLGQLGDLLGDDGGALADLFGEGLEDGLGGLLSDPDALGDLLEGGGGDALAGAAPAAECLVPEGGGLGALGTQSTPLPDAPQELVDAVSGQVEELRELELVSPVDATFLEDAQFRARVEELIAEELTLEAVDGDQRLLVALGAIPADTDLAELQRDLLGDQVAGFYDPDTGELVVRLGDDGLGATDHVTLAHEIDHALTDQVLGLPDLEELVDSGDADGALAASAWVEGDATLLMGRWQLEHQSLTDQLSALTDPDQAQAQADLEGIPYQLQQELLFPYIAGADAVCAAEQDGGWDAVDARYGDFPATTAAILDPTVTDPPLQVPPAPVPPGYEELLDTTYGAAPLTWLFEAPGGDPDAAIPDPQRGLDGWAGGRAQVVADGDATGIRLAFAEREPGLLCDALGEWYIAAFEDVEETPAESARVFERPDSTAVLRCGDGTVQLGIGPDLDVATTLAADTA